MIILTSSLSVVNFNFLLRFWFAVIKKKLAFYGICALLECFSVGFLLWPLTFKNRYLYFLLHYSFSMLHWWWHNVKKKMLTWPQLRFWGLIRWEKKTAVTWRKGNQGTLVDDCDWFRESRYSLFIALFKRIVFVSSIVWWIGCHVAKTKIFESNL